MPKQAPPETGGAGNLLTRKFGPLPAWGWLVVAIVGFYLYKRVSGGSSNSTSATPSTGVAPPTASETLPGGYSYNGPASGAAAFQQTVGSAASPGNPGGPAVSPGNTGNGGFTATGGSFALPPPGTAYNWQLTPSGAAAYQANYGQPWQSGPQPSTVPVPNLGTPQNPSGAYTWQVVPA